MKRFQTILLTLLLSVAMLAPEFSMLPAAYAQDQTPALEQTAGEAEGIGAADPETGEEELTAEGESAAPAEEAAEGALTEEDAEAPAVPAADPADGEEPAEGETSALEFGAYDRLSMVELDEGGSLVVPEDMQEAVTKSHSEYGNCVLVNGKVADLNAVRLDLGEFNFNEGSAGRLSFDGLKDKDVGMSVKVLLYLDDEAEPVGEFALKKQMGKKEWANSGERSVSLGSREITGAHNVSLGFKVEGKKATAKTTIALRELQFCKTTVPVLYFNIDESEGTIEAMNNSGDHSVECYGKVDLVVPDAFNADDTFRDEYGTQTSLYGLDLEYIRGRGNSTWDSDKKPYKVKFDKAQDLFGFGKNKHWVLLANRYDNSLIRNRMTYWLGQQMGMEYTPQSVPVDVVMNGEYYGSYQLCEQIRVGTGRVTIDDLDDIEDAPAVTDPLIQTGGYLLSMDFEEDEDRLFTTEKGMRAFIESPDENVKYYKEYIKAYMQKVENAIYGDDFKDADGHSYTEYLDLDAAVNYWWVQEFSANGDAYGSGSTYLYKKRDKTDEPGKLYWGPLWDFDYVAWGDLEYGDEPPVDLDYTDNEWFRILKTDPVFVEKMKTRWNEEGGLKDLLNEITKPGGRLDMYLAQMEASYNYDHAKYGPYQSEFTNYKDEIEQLREWIIQRSENVDKEVSNLNIEDHKVTFKVDGKVISEVIVKGYLKERHFPEVPLKKGYVFTGWFDDKEGEPYGDGSLVTADIVLNAEYVREDKVVQPKHIYFRNYNVYVSGTDSYYQSEGLGWFFPEYRIMPEEASESDLTWTSSDESIAAPEDGGLKLLGYGDVTITATTANGVSNSFKLHVIDEEDINFPDEVTINKKAITLKKGQYTQLRAIPSPEKCYDFEQLWVSSNENVATVDEIGVVSAVGVGTANVMLVDTENRAVRICKVTVRPATNKGLIVKRAGNTYKITSDKKGARTAMLIRAKNAVKVVVPAYIKYDGKKYSINKINAKAFAKSKAQRVTIKTKKLTKARVKNSLRGSKVKKIYVRVGKKSVNKTYIKKYKKIFTQKNAGKGVIISNA